MHLSAIYIGGPRLLQNPLTAPSIRTCHFHATQLTDQSLRSPRKALRWIGLGAVCFTTQRFVRHCSDHGVYGVSQHTRFITGNVLLKRDIPIFFLYIFSLTSLGYRKTGWSAGRSWYESHGMLRLPCGGVAGLVIITVISSCFKTPTSTGLPTVQRAPLTPRRFGVSRPLPQPLPSGSRQLLLWPVVP